MRAPLPCTNPFAWSRSVPDDIITPRGGTYYQVASRTITSTSHCHTGPSRPQHGTACYVSRYALELAPDGQHSSCGSRHRDALWEKRTAGRHANLALIPHQNLLEKHSPVVNNVESAVVLGAGAIRWVIEAGCCPKRCSGSPLPAEMSVGGTGARRFGASGS